MVPMKQTTKPTKGYSALIYPKVLKEFQRMSDRSGVPLVRLINWCLDEYGVNIDHRLGGIGWGGSTTKGKPNNKKERLSE